jgi:hypothetical protein
MKDPVEVSPFSRETMLRWLFRPSQSLSIPLQNGIRFFHVPIPAYLSANLAIDLPFREKYGFTMFYLNNKNGLDSASSPVAILFVEPYSVKGSPATCHFG